MLRTEEIQESVKEREPIDIEEASRTLELGVHQLAVSNTVIVLSVNHTYQIEKIIASSLDNFPQEDTLVHDTIGRPTIIARVDCSIGPNGILPYECDDRPAGLGVQNLLENHHRGTGISELLQNHSIETLGAELVVVRHPDALPGDDHHVLDVIDSSQLNGHAVIARGEPHMFNDENAYKELARRSASTIKTEGDKTYGLTIPEYGSRLITDINDLPLKDRSFAIKTTQGSKCSGVMVYLSKPDQREHGTRGVVTHSKATRVAEEFLPVLVEEFKPPIKTRLHGNMILRVIALVSKDDVRVIGGAYVARPEMLVHGASNSIAGLVTVESGVST